MDVCGWLFFDSVVVESLRARRPHSRKRRCHTILLIYPAQLDLIHMKRNIITSLICVYSSIHHGLCALVWYQNLSRREDLYESIYDPACCLPHPELLEPQRNKRRMGENEKKKKHWKNKFFLDVAKWMMTARKKKKNRTRKANPPVTSYPIGSSLHGRKWPKKLPTKKK